MSDPHSFALVQDALDSISDSGSEVPQEVLKVAVHGPETQAQLAMWQETMEDEAIETLGAINAPKVKPQLDPMSSDEGSISEGESEFHEILTSSCAGETEILSKGQRRRILAAAKGISEAATAEAERRSCPEKVPRVRRLRTGYKILEIFTWSCLLSRFAYGLGWEYLEPLTLPGWDLKSPKVEKEAWDYLHRVNPDFIAVAWPCTEWTIMQNANQKIWTQKQALLARRVEARKLLRFTRRVTLWQARSGRAILGENPLLSLAWKEPDIIDAFGHLEEAICDECQYGLRHPENGISRSPRGLWVKLR